jgi:hypothetical protein
MRVDGDAALVNKKRRKVYEIFDEEAELSGEDSGDEDLNDSELDRDLEGFIDDATLESSVCPNSDTPVNFRYFNIAKSYIYIYIYISNIIYITYVIL